MSDYKKTLNLPSTAFPMKANLSQREPAMLKRWQDMGVYQKIREQSAELPKFIYHHGPPYANGAIHLGHALNMSLKDFVVKAKTLAGFNTAFIPGWDCHGLPIELNVEKKKGRAGDKLSTIEFRKACREYAMQQVKIQQQGFERLGVLADWKNPYLTMNFKYEADIIRALAKIIEHGDMQQGFKPVYWCLDCASALAEAEVEYKDKVSPAIDVRFPFIDKDSVAELFNVTLSPEKTVSIPIWTTTPWTLPANEAVSVHAELNYALVDTGNDYLIIAEDLLAQTMNRYHIEDYHVLAHVKGAELELQKLQHPFYEKQVPVILGEHVTVEAGTGAVHTAPAHGEDDYRVGLNYDLPVNNPVGARGVYFETTPLFGGQHIYKANPAIIALLEENQMLLHKTDLEHSYPHCWRHKTPLLFRATPQWFISMEKQGLREQALNEIKKVRWVPEWGENRINAMIEGRPDWCISRQRTWGVPICVFVHKQSSELHPNTLEFMEKVAQLVEAEGVDAWERVDINEWLGNEAADYEKVTDILDVWFESGVSHYAVMQQREEMGFPADLYLEGSDQHRGWFQTSLLTACAMEGQAPFKQVLTHGFTVDANGHKMSKSLGNVIEPDKIFKQLGADILRLWVASTDYRSEITVSDEIFKRTADGYRRIRNTARFLLANLHDFNPAEHLVAAGQLVELDAWIIKRAQQLQTEIIQAYDDYQFHKVYQHLHHFCSIELGSFYLDVIKDRQYTCKTESNARRSAQTALYHVLMALVHWMAPILSYTADEIWQFIPGEHCESIFLSRFYNNFPELDHIEMDFWTMMSELRNAVNQQIEALRADSKLGSSLEAKVTLYAEPTLQQALARVADELRFVFITSAAALSDAEVPATAKATEVEGVSVTVEPVTAAKCERCWHRCDDIGQNAEHPDLCGRCVTNISGAGEVRHYA